MKNYKAFTLIELLIVIAVISIVVAMLGGLLFGVAGCEYSTGYRDGTIQKLSEKGIVFDTWEGELALPGFVGNHGGKSGQGYGNVWAFSVPDDDVVEAIQSIDARQFVRLHYSEMLSSVPWKGSSSYLITRIELLDEDESTPDLGK